MRINTILTSYISNYGGPSYVCTHILEAMSAEGIDVSLYCVSGDRIIHKPFHRYCMPLWSQRLGYKLLSEETWAKYAEWRYLRSLKEQDIAYIWNSASIDTYKTVKSAGHIILTESVNTHRANSKEILDAEYRQLGLTPDHGIDDKLVALERDQLELVDYVFSPSSEVTKSFLNADIPSKKIIQTSYGLTQDKILDPRDVAKRAQRTDLTAIFVGRIGIRKGIHLLLKYWVEAGVKGKLKLVGEIEPNARHLVEPYLNKHNIEHIPYTHDLKSVYLNADIFLFPSLEEGSPLVTYLALGAGLPCIVSPMGGGGIINHENEGLVVDAHNADEWIDSIRKIFSDNELRLKMSSNAYNKAEEYLWGNVGRRRLESLRIALSKRQ